ncbi:MAG: hypothetical protein AAF078_05235, partial [Planctomycetota bacterium]
MASRNTPHRVCIAGRSPFVGGAEIAAERLALGLADDPSGQRRLLLGWNLDHGHLAFLGAPTSGVTT